jgi:hypothetical protein
MSDINRDNGLFVFLRKRDNLARPINLTYNHQKTYPSACGGCLSLVSTLLILIYLAFKIKDVALQKGVTASNLTLNVTAGVSNVQW